MSIDVNLDSPGYKNWIKGCLILKYGKEAVQELVEEEIIKFLDGILSSCPNNYCDQCTIANITPCRSRGVCRGPKGKCEYHLSSDPSKISRPCPNGVCDKLFQEIVTAHDMSPKWTNTDSTQWCNNPWTIAKCFMPDGYSHCSDAAETDFTGVLSVLSNAKFMKNSFSLKTTNVFKQLKVIRNELMHAGECEIDDAFLGRAVSKVEQMIKDTYGHHLPSNINKIQDRLSSLKKQKFKITTQDEYDSLVKLLQEESTKNRDSNSKMIQLQNKIVDLKSNIPLNIKDQHLSTIEQWKQDDMMFVETRASRSISTSLQSKNCILVTGVPGSGKTTLVQHEALKLERDNGFQIVPITDPIDIHKYHNKSKNQVFVADDFVGDRSLNDLLCNKWRLSLSNIESIFNNQLIVDIESKLHININTTIKGNDISETGNNKGRTILLLASRLHIFIEASSFVQFETLQQKNIDLTDEKYSLHESDVTDILMKFIPEHRRVIDNMVSSLSDLQCLPFIAKLSMGRDEIFVKKMFEDHIKALTDEINQMKFKNEIKFLCICLVTLFEKVYYSWFDDIDEIPQHDKDKVTKLLAIFKMDILNPRDREIIKENFRYLDGSYLRTWYNCWRMVHQIVSDTAATVCGTYLFDFFLQNSFSTFISKYYSFQQFIANNRSIKVSAKKENAYFKRLVDDIMKGDLISSFQNCQLSENVFRKMLIRYLTSRAGLDSKLRSLCSKAYIDVNPFQFSCLYGYIDIVSMLVEMKCRTNIRDKEGSTALHYASLAGNLHIAQMLVSKGGDINARDNNGLIPLHDSCVSGDLETTCFLMAEGSDVKAIDHSGCIPLHYHVGFYREVSVKKILDSETGSYIKGYYPLYIDVTKLLLDMGSDVNAYNHIGQTPLHISVNCQGHIEVSKLLLERKCNPNACNKNGETPLHISCNKGYLDVTQLLLDKGSNIHACDQYDRRPLHHSCYNGHVEVVKLLFANGSTMARDIDGLTPLHLSCTTGKLAVTKILLRKGNFVTIGDYDGKTPLHFSCSNGHVDVTQLLLDKGSDINIGDNFGQAALHHSCNKGHVDVAKVLLQKGSRLNACDKNNWTPLHWACYEGHGDVTQLLLDQGCDINLFDSHRKTPLLLSCYQGHTTVSKLLLDKGCDINISDNYGQIPLHHSCIQGHVQITTLLLGNSSNYNAFDMACLTPLHRACSMGRLEIAKLLLDKGCDIDICAPYGGTPLHISCTEGHADIATLLINKGCKVTCLDNKGRTPLQCASLNKRFNVIKVLLEKGCDVSVCDIVLPVNHVFNKVLTRILVENIKFIQD